MIIAGENISKRYTNNWIIRNATFQFDQNIVYGIKGANGSGKSTFLQLLSGYLSPSEGKLKYNIDGHSISRGEVYQHISMTAPYIDIEEVFTFERFLVNYTKFKKLDGDLTVDKVIEMSGLQKFAKTEIENYSSGMKQRVKLITAISSQCEVVILDEPTSYLDNVSKQWIYDLIQNRNNNKMIILASNDDEDLAQCDEIIPIDTFKVVQ